MTVKGLIICEECDMPITSDEELAHFGLCKKHWKEYQSELTKGCD